MGQKWSQSTQRRHYGKFFLMGAVFFLAFFIVWGSSSLFFLGELSESGSFSEPLVKGEVLRSVFWDVKCFPVVKDVPEWVGYEDSYGDPRQYGGERVHEGCDIMAERNERGYYHVCSMTDGIVENVGWLKLGGYRIGIRSPGGAYFYYAHLCEYARDFKTGDQVKAGEMIGTMGDSGYSETEGTVGNFDVHLHLGIYFNVGGKEKSINPYAILRHFEQKDF